MNREIKLTICSVSYKSSSILRLNFDLLNYLNNEKNTPKWQWLFVENSTNNKKGLKPFNEHCLIIPGIKDSESPQHNKGSCQHGLALNKALKYIKSQYLLIMDPDFYVVKKDWINDLLNHMKKNKLAFFGVPWHPRHLTKYRYFPCVHFLLIDTKKVDITSLNFSPYIVDSDKKKNKYILFFTQLNKIVSHIPVAGFIFSDLKKRLSINSGRDTGYLLFKNFYNRPEYKTELLTPVYKLNNLTYSTYAKFIDYLLPEKYRLLPKYVTDQGFKEYHYPDLYSLGIEEFIWKNTIFGFHLRNYYLKEVLKKNINIKALEKIIINFRHLL